MTEILFDLRRNGHLTLAKALILVLFLTGIYSTMSFTESTRTAVNQSFSGAADRNLYSLTDTLTDADEFEAFRRDPGAVAKLGEFYNTLNASDQVNLVSAFAQPIPVADFKGGDSFDSRASSDYTSPGMYTDPVTGRQTRDVLSMQMNENTFNFYNLTLTAGELPDWREIDYVSRVVPVLLGANYLGIYDIGDEIDAQFYSEEFTFRVSGFLAKDTSMFYKNDINFFLDDYLIVPYPAQLTTSTDESLFFDGILSFAMANSDLAAPKSLSSDQVITHLESVARDTGFTDYALIGVPQYLTQYALTRSLLLENTGLVQALQTMLGITGLFVLAVLGSFAFRRRVTALDVRWKLGTSGTNLQGSLAVMVLVEWVIVAAVFALVYGNLPTSESAAAAGAGIVLAALAGLDMGISNLVLRRHLDWKDDR